MAWQEKALQAAIRAYLAKSGQVNGASMEAALRAALPLIEVTPGMREAGHWLPETMRAMLLACAKEGRDAE